jgi:hypothetical protein
MAAPAGDSCDGSGEREGRCQGDEEEEGPPCPAEVGGDLARVVAALAASGLTPDSARAFLMAEMGESAGVIADHSSFLQFSP